MQDRVRPGVHYIPYMSLHIPYPNRLVEIAHPSLTDLYDVVPTNQPDDFNVAVADTNPVHHINEAMGLAPTFSNSTEVWR